MGVAMDPMDPDSFWSIPRRGFFDTNVVNLTLDYGEYIHENVPLPEDLHPTVRQEVEALAGIFATGQRAFWQFAISPLTWQEVNATNDPTRRRNLKQWFAELWHCWRGIVTAMDNLPSFIEAEETRIQLLSSGILDVLPDVADRILICDAVVYRCDCFCTFDKRTILRHRERLKVIPIEILTPSEWWAKIRPWAAIWL
jgi:hypothetical protein